MFEKIYLHVGLPKTGSTYLQNALDNLSRQDALTLTTYPVLDQSDDFRRIQSGNGKVIANQLLEENVPVFSPEAVRQFTQDILDAADRSKPNLLISSELFSRAAPQRLATLLEFLGSHARTIAVFAVVRPFVSLCRSGYHQQVKRHSESDKFDETFFATFSQKLVSQISMIGSVEVPVHLIDYRDSGLLGVFLGALGEDPYLEFEFNEKRVNRSLTSTELQILRAINAAFRDNGLAKRISDRWIYSNPEAVSDQEEVDRTQLIDVFRRVADANITQLASGTCREMLRRLLSDDGNATAGRGDLRRRPAGEGDEAAGSEGADLLRMALEEVARSGNSDPNLDRYTRSLTPTRESFDPVHYLLLNRDVLVAGVDPVQHYRRSGRREGRYSAFNTNSTPFE